MSILTDIRTAAVSYASSNVTTSVSTLTPDVPGTINPDEEFKFNIVATNAGAPDGIALVNIRYHVTASGAGVKLIVPPETVAIARTGVDETSSQLNPGALVTAMFLFPITPDGQSLGVGDGDAINGLKGKAGSAVGVGSISMHIHGDPDLLALFPPDRTSVSGTRSVNIV